MSSLFFCCFLSSSTCKKKEQTAARATRAVKRSIGSGSSILETRKLAEENNRARKLQKPKAVAAKRVGKKYEFATKLILKVQVTPNFVSKKKIKNNTES